MYLIEFNRDTELILTKHPYGLNDLFFEKGEEAQISKYKEYEIGKDMWAITFVDGSECFVMKEDVNIKENA